MRLTTEQRRLVQAVQDRSSGGLIFNADERRWSLSDGSRYRVNSSTAESLKRRGVIRPVRSFLIGPSRCHLYEMDWSRLDCTLTSVL